MAEKTVHTTGHETLTGTVVGEHDPLSAAYEVMDREGFSPDSIGRCEINIRRQDNTVQGAAIWEVVILLP